MSLIHPTAVISSEAKLGEGVRVGAFAIIEGAVTVGEGCVIHPFARLAGPLTLGARNVVHSHAVLGEWPQDRKFNGDFSETVIGDDNIFREGVTIHRGTGLNTKTVIGSRNFFMVNSHVGHNCVVGNDVTLVNGALLAGHVKVFDRAIIGANCAIHQFCRVGRLAMVSNISGQSVEFPPFCISMRINSVQQLNLVGLRRSGVPRANIDALRTMFRLLFRRGKLLKTAIAELPPEIAGVPEVKEFCEFCLTAKRGVARYVAWSAHKGAGVEGE